MKFASFSERFFALIIDSIFLIIFENILPFNLLYYDIFPNFENSFFEALTNFEFLILSPFYFVGMRYWNKGQTLGKKAIGIKTVTEEGNSLTFFQSVIDCLGYYILILDLIIGAIISNNNQRMSQACAGTVVIKEYS